VIDKGLDMAVKLTIHEICPKCGELAAWQESDGTVHVNRHDCPGSPYDPRSFRPGEVTFVPRHESLTDDELDEIEQWGTRHLQPFYISYTKSQRIVHTIKTLLDKNKRLSSDLSEMAKDCAKLQKVLLDIGYKIRNDVLGIDMVGKDSPRSWRCDCDLLNYPTQKRCSNCGKQKEN